MSDESKDLRDHLSDQVNHLVTFESFFWHRIRSQFVINAIRKFYGQVRPTVLDIGAGAGIFAAHFRHQFPAGEYAFIEPIPVLAQALRARFSGSCDWMNRKSYNDADAILLLDVLEHQKNDVEFLKNIVAKARTGSVFVLTSPAFYFLWSDWDIKVGHYRRYTIASLRLLAAGAGLQVIHSQYLFQSMVLAGLIRKFLPVQNTEFPKLSNHINELLYCLARVELAIGSWIPFGSSVALIARKIDLTQDVGFSSNK